MIKRTFYHVVILVMATGIATCTQPVAHPDQTGTTKENTMQQIPEELRSIALQFLNANDKAWWVRDVTRSYGKLDLERLYWIIDSEDKSVTVVQDHNGKFFPLNGDDGLALSGKLLAKTHGEEPWLTMGAEKLGKTIISWYRDPRAHILTETFFSRQQPVLKSWLTGREKDPQALRDLCREPIFTLGGGKWSLDFNAINRHGGVERWIMNGQAAGFTIKTVSATKIKDDGTFNFPDEL
jgi:hypothetical protein